jgi:methenyltetrahydromethanopterin cyclohydrolase
MRRILLNDRAGRLCEAFLADCAALGVEPGEIGGARVIDAGVSAPGGLAAGIALARLCLADLADVRLESGPVVAVSVDRPVEACLASQYAGWQLKGDGWFGMASGPMRACYGKEELYESIGCRESPDRVVGVIESSSLPPPDVIAFLSEKLRLPASAITLWVAPTASLAGGVQVVARSVEVAMHKLHALGYPLSNVRSGHGIAPLPPPGKNDIVSLGRTNDAILYGGRVHLWVDDEDERLSQLGPRVPSSASPAYGEPFLDLFNAAGYDFYALDPHLFAPAEVTFHNVRSGRTMAFGSVRDDLLRRSFGLGG